LTGTRCRSGSRDDVRELVELADPMALVLVVGSDLARTAALATYELLLANCASGQWRGKVFAADRDQRRVGAIQMLPVDPSLAVEQLEDTLRASIKSMHLMRSE